MPMAEDRIVPLTRVAEVISPGVDKRGEQVGLLKDLVESVRGILVEFGLGREVIGETPADAVGGLVSQFCQGPFERRYAFGMAFPEDLATTGQGHELFDAAVEDAVERVVVGRRNGIVFVIVTARAPDREPKHAARDHVDAVVDDLVFHPEEAASDREKAHRRLVPRPFSLELVGGKLEHQKTVVGEVFVQRRDDPVAINPGMRPVLFLAGIDIALRVRITRHVEPMPRPVFSVLRRRERLINDRGPFVGGNR